MTIAATVPQAGASDAPAAGENHASTGWMVDSTTPHVRMTHGYLRRIGVIGLANTSGYWLRPASPARLGSVRPRPHAAVESTI